MNYARGRLAAALGAQLQTLTAAGRAQAALPTVLSRIQFRRHVMFATTLADMAPSVARVTFLAQPTLRAMRPVGSAAAMFLATDGEQVHNEGQQVTADSTGGQIHAHAQVHLFVSLKAGVQRTLLVLQNNSVHLCVH